MLPEPEEQRNHRNNCSENRKDGFPLYPLIEVSYEESKLNGNNRTGEDVKTAGFGAQSDTGKPETRINNSMLQKQLHD